MITKRGNRIHIDDVSKITYEQMTKILRQFNHLGYDFPNENSLADYLKGGVWLEKDQSEAVLCVLGFMEQTNRYPKEQIQDDNRKAVSLFGTTNRWDYAGYLLTTGELLDFSEGQGMRTLDHRSINQILEDRLDENSSRTDGLIMFVNYGNIRVQENGMELSRPMTSKQKEVVARAIRGKQSFYVDIANRNGIVIKEFGYEFPFISDIDCDIREYFDNLKI